MNIVILDGYTENPGDLSWEKIEELGNLTVYDRTPSDDEEEIIRRIGMAEIVVTNKTPISKKIMDSCTNIKQITVLATGYNVVDYIYAKEKGIPVTNVPIYGTASVSQFVMALLLEICHHVSHHSRAVHEGRWSSNPDWCFWDYPLIELSGKTMGIIGFGRIGKATGKIAKAMGMKIIAYDNHPNRTGEEIAKYVDLDTLLAESDVVALHCPLFPETEGIINKKTIAKMKDGVIILNNSRGQLIVEQDLADALNSGKIYAAGIDVVSTEPIRETNPLLNAPNCIITPHISWAPRESRQRIIDCTVDNIKACIAGEPINVVNK
ncbi:D-2-hydroxyacid dehydrogenase [Hespellia stercorisuis]|uniref:Glycerate dehydrogenase n=1 Tax=Hespellia stercorisuis DSM 15480 TaxID=1121950 RepID=A0A1M6KBI9_9FIRM|nr:D-2-hydroxyacid dehydrogenase [Hespellia stercorisuis]SHJ56264.1 glycerate dehydrogenase [Hespellia stercorisuis DSM 15480]